MTHITEYNLKKPPQNVTRLYIDSPPPLKGVLLIDFRYFSLFLAVLKPGEITTEKSTTEMYVYLTLIEYL